MKTFQEFSLLLALALTFNLRAATNDVPQVSGTVVDAQGNPVTNASVDFYQYPTRPSFGAADMQLTQQTTTDGQGAFAFPAFNGIGFVVATKPGLPPAWRMWYSAPDEPQKIALAASSVLAGVVADDAGRPVADAEVWVSSAFNKTVSENGQPNFVFGKISRQLFSTHTSDDGQFRIENFPADAQASLSVKKTGMALHHTENSYQFDQLPFHAGQEDITLILDPAGSVSGTVVVRGTGQPLANAVIGLQPSVSGTANYLLSDQETTASVADGSFQIPDVPAGSYRVMAEFTNEPIADWVVDAVPITVTAGQSTSGVQMQAYKGGVVEVTVRGKTTHELLAGAEVSLNSEGYSRGAATGTNGVAYFRLSPGQFNVFVNKPDWAQVQEQATVTDGQSTELTIELPEPFIVRGIVLDISGAPVAGANISVLPDYGNNSTGAKSDADGHYEVSWQEPSWAGAGNQSFYLLARDTVRKLAAIQELDETTRNLDVTLKPAMSLSGRVQDPNGQPITNATAYIMCYQEDSSFSIGRQRISSDEQGRIHAEALPLGQRYGCYVSARGFGSAQEQMDAANPSASHYDFPALVLKFANLKLAGRVLGQNGAPAAGVQIFLQGDGQPNGNAVTDADGRFSFDAVCEGPVTVTANMKGAYYGQAEAMGGDTNVVIRFNPNIYTAANPQTLTGTVDDPTGNPATGALVVVTPSMGQVDVAKTDDSGAYTVTWSPQPGMRGAKYFAIARDLEHNLAVIEPIDTNKARVDLRLGPALSISGTVQDATGTPLAHANVNLNLMAGNMGGLVEYHTIKVDSDGTFTIPALPMGQRYLIFATATGHGSAQKNIGVAQSRTNSIQLAPFKLKTANLELAGRVLERNGKPAAGAYVFINGRGQPNGNAQTDRDGHFKFKVCEGPIQIYANMPGPGRNNFAMSYARGGDTDVVVKMGVQQRQRQVVVPGIPLKPQAWTLGALVSWPTTHKAGGIILLSLQAAVLLGTGGGIFWFTRKRG